MARPLTRILTTTALGLVALTAFGHRAYAYEATTSGLSVGAGLESFIDATVTKTDGDPLRDSGGHVGASALVNWGDLAMGAAVAGRPDILGDGRLLVGGRIGWQPTFGTTRVQVLGDGGIHRFTHVGGSLFATSTPDAITTPYVGFQVGMTRSFFRGGHLEYGLALLVRHDLRQQTALRSESGQFTFGIADEGSSPPPPAPTELRVGGTMVGVALSVGFRFEKQRRPDARGALAKIDAIDANDAIDAR
jgi:hypothetical protein